MAEPIAKVQMTPKSVYFPQHEAKPPPSKTPAQPANALYSSSQQQTQERE